MKRTAQLYLLTVSVVGLGIFFILQSGSKLPAPAPALSTQSTAQGIQQVTYTSDSSVLGSVKSGLWQNASNPLSRLFLQLMVIISASFLIGRLFTRCGQPAVVGEMMAGILLGPSLFGLLAPNIFHFIFAASSLDALRLFSQIGVCLFMFAVGMELDVSQLRHKARAAMAIGHGSIVIPYFFGVTLALLLYKHLAQPGASFVAFALFMGISEHHRLSGAGPYFARSRNP